MCIINTLMENFLIKMVLSLLIVHSLVFCDKNNEQRFQFPEFDYKETSKNVSFTAFPSNEIDFSSVCEIEVTCLVIKKNYFRNYLIENLNQHVSKVLTVRNYQWM